jgi:hypothetical protein
LTSAPGGSLLEHMKNVSRIALLLGPFAIVAACSSSSSTNTSDGGLRDSGAPDTYTATDGSPVIDRDATEELPPSCTQDDGVSFGSDVCNKCMDSRCCPSVDACYKDQDCNDLSDCITACLSGEAGADAGPSCRTDCRTAHPNSTDKYDKVLTCQTDSCGTECQ